MTDSKGDTDIVTYANGALTISDQGMTLHFTPYVQEAYPMLLQQTYRPANVTAMDKTLTLIDKLAAAVSLWRLNCNMDIEAAQIAYGSMKG